MAENTATGFSIFWASTGPTNVITPKAQIMAKAICLLKIKGLNKIT